MNSVAASPIEKLVSKIRACFPENATSTLYVELKTDLRKDSPTFLHQLKTVSFRPKGDVYEAVDKTIRLLQEFAEEIRPHLKRQPQEDWVSNSAT